MILRIIHPRSEYLKRVQE